MWKYCKECWKINENPLLKYCYEHKHLNKSINSLWAKKPIKNKWNNSNTTAKFLIETKKQIVERDKCCIICGSPWTDCHHVYFWTECEYWKNRNDVSKWVLLCRLCHWKAHACTKWEWVRQKCIDYLKKV